MSNILNEEEGNTELFQFLETSFVWFDQSDTEASFHLMFLIELTKYLGFYPEKIHLEHDYFNLQDGKFETVQIGDYAVSGENLIILKQLLGIKFDALSTIKLNAKQRQSFINLMLLYYELHLGGFKKPKSLQILNQVFN